jgi:hypothetical protein
LPGKAASYDEGYDRTILNTYQPFLELISGKATFTSIFSGDMIDDIIGFVVRHRKDEFLGTIANVCMES